MSFAYLKTSQFIFNSERDISILVLIETILKYLQKNELFANSFAIFYLLNFKETQVTWDICYSFIQ